MYLRNIFFMLCYVGTKCISVTYSLEPFFRKGALIGRNDKVIIGCVAGEQVLQFKLDISIKEFNLVKDKRIGRILPPYITRIQQKCSQNMIREGTMPIPKELFMSFED